MDNGNITPARASLVKAIRKGFIDVYDQLGYVVVVTLVTFVLAAVVLSLGMLVARSFGGTLNVVKVALMIPAALVVYLCGVGIYYYAYKVIFREHPDVLHTIAGIGLLIKPALKLFVVDLVIAAVLAADFAFFLAMFAGSHNIFFAGLAILIGYASLIWLIMAIYQLPLLVVQLSTESGMGVGVILRKSFLLMADNPGFTLGLFLVIIAFAVLCAIPMFVGFAVLFFGASAFLVTHALRELFIRYGIIEAEPEAADEGESNG